MGREKSKQKRATQDGESLIGKKVYIVDTSSIYYGEWGIVKLFDGEYYHVAIANGDSSIPVFARNEMRLAAK